MGKGAAELKFVQVMIIAIKSVEDGIMKVFERLLATNLDGSGDDLVLLGKLFSDGTAGYEKFKCVESLSGGSGCRGWLSCFLWH